MGLIANLQRRKIVDVKVAFHHTNFGGGKCWKCSVAESLLLNVGGGYNTVAAQVVGKRQKPLSTIVVEKDTKPQAMFSTTVAVCRCWLSGAFSNFLEHSLSLQHLTECVCL